MTTTPATDAPTKPAPTARVPRQRKAPASTTPGVTVDVREAKAPTKSFFVLEAADGSRDVVGAYLSRSLIERGTDPATGTVTVTLSFKLA